MVVALVGHNLLALPIYKGWLFLNNRSVCLSLKLLSHDFSGTPLAFHGASLVYVVIVTFNFNYHEVNG